MQINVKSPLSCFIAFCLLFFLSTEQIYAENIKLIELNVLTQNHDGHKGLAWVPTLS